MENVTYDHPRIGTIVAVPAGEGFPASADWIAQVTGKDGNLGYVVDSRADDDGYPSPVSPDSDESQPYEVFNAEGKYVCSTHSLRGALLAIGNNAD